MDSSDALEDKDSGPEVQINFPESVMSRIEEMMGETEQFDCADFDAVAYINKLFPTEQSLSGVEAAAARAEWRLQEGARRLGAALRRAPARPAATRALLSARKATALLARQLQDVATRAQSAETAVREITAEIKQLDRAKSNLTAAITALNHYHMLAGGAKALRELTKARQYGAVLPPLQALHEVLQHFAKYEGIAELDALRDEVAAVRRELASQLDADVRAALGPGAGPGLGPAALPAACAALDVLDPSVRESLLQWLVSSQLAEYRHLFSAEQEPAWLTHVDQRYSWLKRHLLSLEQRLGAALPPHWAVSERIAASFCEITRSELSSLMWSRRSELDVKLLLSAIQKTNNFEQLLHRRFTGETDESADPPKQATDKETTATESQSKKFVWRGAISSCFEPHLHLYISSLDSTLRALLTRCEQEAKEVTPGAPGAVLASCGDLFLLYKRCLVQCAALSRGEPMLQLCSLFKKFLAEYAKNVLQAALPARPSLAVSFAAALQEKPARLPPNDVARIATVLATADYCLETASHLQLKLQEKIIPELSNKVDLEPERKLLLDTVAQCEQLLVQDLEQACAPALHAMARVPWSQLTAVGDASPYVSQLTGALRTSVPPLRDLLASSRKYFTRLCIKYAESFIPKFVQTLRRCRPMSTAGAEQLLLDAHTLKTALLELPSVGSEVKRAPPAPYKQLVSKLMTRAELLLKLVMAPLDDRFVQHFLQLLPDSTAQEFREVLDMKGLKLSKAQLAALESTYKEVSKAAADNEY